MPARTLTFIFTYTRMNLNALADIVQTHKWAALNKDLITRDETPCLTVFFLPKHYFKYQKNHFLFMERKNHTKRFFYIFWMKNKFWNVPWHRRTPPSCDQEREKLTKLESSEKIIWSGPNTQGNPIYGCEFMKKCQQFFAHTARRCSMNNAGFRHLELL